jgi:hypothetical protein
MQEQTCRAPDARPERRSPATVAPGPKLATSGNSPIGRGGCEDQGVTSTVTPLIRYAAEPNASADSAPAADSSHAELTCGGFATTYSPADSVPQIRYICAQRSTRLAQLKTAHSRQGGSESVATVEWSHCVMAWRVALMAIARQAGEGGFRRAGVGTTGMGVA